MLVSYPTLPIFHANAHERFRYNAILVYTSTLSQYTLFTNLPLLWHLPLSLTTRSCFIFLLVPYACTFWKRNRVSASSV